MTEIIKAQNPADLLALLPSLLGFVPKQSVVVLPFKGNRTYGAMRLDLPRAGPPAVNKRLATFIVGTLCKLPGVDSVVLVVVTDSQFGAQSKPPSNDLMKTLTRQIRLSGLGLRDALCQAGDGWASYLDDDTPAGGHPLSEIDDSGVRESLPPDQRDMGLASTESRVPGATSSEIDRVRQQFDRWEQFADQPQAREELPPTLEALEDLPQLMEDALAWDDEQISRDAALLLFAWQRPPVRDAAMLQWATDLASGELILDANQPKLDRKPGAPSKIREYTPSEISEYIGGLMFGIGPRPDADRIDRAIRLVREVVALAEDERRVAPLCMLTWLSWALGHGSDAGRYLAEAASIRPDYGMVKVLSTMVNNGMMPEWAFAKYGPES